MDVVESKLGEPQHVRTHWLSLIYSGGSGLVGEGLQDDCRHLLDRLHGGVDDGQGVGSKQCLSPAQLPRALLEGGIGGVGPTLLSNLTQPGGRCDNAVAPVAQRPESVAAAVSDRDPRRPADSWRRRCRVATPGT